jgi:hypothetical protein
MVVVVVMMMFVDMDDGLLSWAIAPIYESCSSLID